MVKAAELSLVVTAAVALEVVICRVEAIDAEADVAGHAHHIAATALPGIGCGAASLISRTLQVCGASRHCKKQQLQAECSGTPSAEHR